MISYNTGEIIESCVSEQIVEKSNISKVFDIIKNGNLLLQKIRTIDRKEMIIHYLKINNE